MIQKFLLFFGERLAFILFFFFVLGMLFSGNITQAFSEEQDPVVHAESNWYEKGIALAVNTKQERENTVEIKTAEITPTPTPVPVISTPNNDIWERLADCETHRNWSANTGNGYYGGLQFSLSAWVSVGGSGLPSSASRDEQILRGKMLQERRGWGPWNMCSRKLGLL